MRKSRKTGKYCESDAQVPGAAGAPGLLPAPRGAERSRTPDRSPDLRHRRGLPRGETAKQVLRGATRTREGVSRVSRSAARRGRRAGAGGRGGLARRRAGPRRPDAHLRPPNAAPDQLVSHAPL